MYLNMIEKADISLGIKAKHFKQLSTTITTLTVALEHLRRHVVRGTNRVVHDLLRLEVLT